MNSFLNVYTACVFIYYKRVDDNIPISLLRLGRRENYSVVYFSSLLYIVLPIDTYGDVCAKSIAIFYVKKYSRHTHSHHQILYCVSDFIDFKMVEIVYKSPYIITASILSHKIWKTLQSHYDNVKVGTYFIFSTTVYKVLEFVVLLYNFIL